jgi:hypothetical protein
MLHQPKLSMPHHSVTAADGFVLTMLAVITLSFGTVILLILCGLRNAARRNAEVDDLLEEVAAEEKQTNRTPVIAKEDKPLEAWEKEGDWWKK